MEVGVVSSGRSELISKMDSFPLSVTKGGSGGGEGEILFIISGVSNDASGEKIDQSSLLIR